MFNAESSVDRLLEAYPKQMIDDLAAGKSPNEVAGGGITNLTGGRAFEGVLHDLSTEEEAEVIRELAIRFPEAFRKWQDEFYKDLANQSVAERRGTSCNLRPSNRALFEGHAELEALIPEFFD
ncbi:hypothetical protein HY948_01300 [Candidatus Gottesmanbacteria bacterium]|nr:hypothetical protein [Candidatus Gottesmanbacteria bacterium]